MSYDYYSRRERAYKRKMRRQIRSIVAMGFTIIVLIFILIIGGMFAKQMAGPTPDIIDSSPAVTSTHSYYFD